MSTLDQRKPIEYRIVQYKEAQELEIEVNRALKDGWEPHGSMFVFATVSGFRVYTQPMIKYDGGL